MLKALLFGFLFTMALSLYNVAVIKWGTSQGNRDIQSRLWHLYGWIIRFLPALYICWQLWGSWTDTIGFCLVYLHMGWTMYDGVINWGRGESFFYHGSVSSGTGSWIDRTFNRIGLLITKLLIFIATISYLLIFKIF